MRTNQGILLLMAFVTGCEVRPKDLGHKIEEFKAPDMSCSFNGESVAHGSSVSAFLDSAVPFGNVCTSESRTCTDGALSGSYAFGSCAVGAAKACLFDGLTINHSASVQSFKTSSVAYGESCEDESRVCSDGILSGSFEYSSCEVGAAKACLFNGETVANGESITAFESDAVTSGDCAYESRTCHNGVLSGSNQHSSCKKVLGGVYKVSAGYRNTCVLGNDDNGRFLRCWGDNQYGQLAQGTNANQGVEKFKIFPTDGYNFTDVAVGFDFVCAVEEKWSNPIFNFGSAQFIDRQIKCWGKNNYGQLGDGTRENRNVPTLVQGLDKTFGSGGTLVVGFNHACVTNYSEVRCWGKGGFVGDGTNVDRLSAVTVSNTGSIEGIMAGPYHTCVEDRRNIRCWGDNQFKQMGIESPTFLNAPSLVQTASANLVGLVLSVGYKSTCVIEAGIGLSTFGAPVKCVGSAALGVSGLSESLNLVSPTGLESGVTQLVSGYLNQVALSIDGKVRVWGKLTGISQDIETPTVLEGLGDVDSLAAGVSHNCAVLTNGAVQCWGWGSSGQLGDGAWISRESPVYVVP